MLPKVFAARGMASEKAMRDKIASTANIAKITKSMKMVAAARMKKDENKRDGAKVFSSMFPRLFTAPEDFESTSTSSSDDKKELFIVNSSDRGLCGGINSNVAKASRTLIDEAKTAGNSVSVGTIGEKGRAQMNRTHPEYLTGSLDEACKNPINFDVCASLAQRFLGTKCDQVTVVHNTFVSMIAYEAVVKVVPGMVTASEEANTPEHLLGHEVEPEDRVEALQNLYEFALAGTIHDAITDGNAAEQSARMAAMDNASNNAEDMIQRFTLAYNRLRQAKITTELIEIISGAESLKSDD